MLLGRRGGRGGWRREGRRGGVDKGSQWGHHARVSTRASHGLQTVGAKRCDMDTWPAGDRTKERVAVDICRTSRTGHGAWSGSRCGASFRGCCRWGWAADEQRVATETGAAMGELHRRRSEGGASAAVQASYFGRYSRKRTVAVAACMAVGLHVRTVHTGTRSTDVRQHACDALPRRRGGRGVAEVGWG